MRGCAEWILRCLLASADADAMLGDLEEELAVRARAKRWYASQIARSIPALLWAPIRQGGVVATFAVAFGACIVQAAVEIATKAVVVSVFTLGSRVGALLSLALTLAMLVLVSYLAARIRRGAALAFAVLIVVSVGIQLMVKAGEGMPLWNQLAALFVGPSAALAGGVMSVRRRRG